MESFTLSREFTSLEESTAEAPFMKSTTFSSERSSPAASRSEPPVLHFSETPQFATEDPINRDIDNIGNAGGKNRKKSLWLIIGIVLAVLLTIIIIIIILVKRRKEKTGDQNSAAEQSDGSVSSMATDDSFADNTFENPLVEDIRSFDPFDQSIDDDEDDDDL